MRVLIVEDDDAIATPLAKGLEREGLAVDRVETGNAALDLSAAASFDVVLLDLGLPDRDGFDVCRELRARSDVPIIVVTARSEEVDRVVGLELGADDYIVKPFSPKEMVARVAALLRRIERPKTASRTLRHGTLTMDLDRHVVQIGGDDVRLTAKEFLLLQYLIEHQGRVLSRDLLLTDVWGYQYTGGTRTVDVHVRRLREKVPRLATAIVTVKQFGYKLEEPGRA